MIISPTGFIEEQKNKSYKELLQVRDELFEEIRAFEEYSNTMEIDKHHPTMKNVYRNNLDYLSKLCVLISEKYNQEYGMEISDNSTYLNVIGEFLELKGLGYNTSLTKEVDERKAGKHYVFQDHVRAMIYAMLTNQIRWYRVEPRLPEIDKLFYDYNPQKILAEKPDYFCKGLFGIKCGNRNSKAQMEALGHNIRLFQRIESEYETIDTFVTSAPADVIVKRLSKKSSPYKMRMIGEALAWEYLRNVGIDGAKPDTHLRRFLGADRMGTGKNSLATISEVNKQIATLSEQTGKSKVEIDNLIWSFCADGFGEICTATPHCEKCPIKEWCGK